VTDTATGATERPEHATSAPPPADLTLVVPTLNERDNVAVLVERLGVVLDGVAWEVVFVDDDSTDGTADLVRALARRTAECALPAADRPARPRFRLCRGRSVERRSVRSGNGCRSPA
jgi:glycosyltransferase involved in cell wall biosynthesis